MTTFRATVIFSYEFESDLAEKENIKIIKDEIANRFGNIHIFNKQVKLERIKNKCHNVQIAIFKPEEILPYACSQEAKRNFIVHGKTYTVHMNNYRYLVFRDNLCCAACGLRGTKMILEQNIKEKSAAAHFNLYGEENGKLILLTKDHIHPKSLGGSDDLSNFQCLCFICNNLKDNAKLTLENVAKLKKIFNENKNLCKKKLRKLIVESKQKLAMPHTEIFSKKIASST